MLYFFFFINAADPDSVPTAHQVRAIATSVNFFQYMDFKALSHYTGWKSSKVFLRHYFRNIDVLKFYAVAAGKVVVPSQADSTLDEDDRAFHFLISFNTHYLQATY